MNQTQRKKTAEQQAAAFNAAHHVGTPVRYWKGVREGDGVISRTKTPAEVLGGHTAVVWIEDCSGCVALSHVAVVFSPVTVNANNRDAQFECVQEETTADCLIIRDVGDGTVLSVTNDADRVVEKLRAIGCLRKGRRLMYYDSENNLDEIVIENGRFAGFRLGPTQQEASHASPR